MHAQFFGAGSSNLHTLTFPDFVSLTGGPAYGGPHLSVAQSQGPLSQRIPFQFFCFSSVKLAGFAQSRFQLIDQPAHFFLDLFKLEHYSSGYWLAPCRTTQI
jgi:hypothetical protein